MTKTTYPLDSKQREIRADYLFELLTRNGETEGKKAYIELCQKDCDYRVLGEALVYLHSDEPFTIRSTPDERIQRFREHGASFLTEGFIEREKQRGVEELEISLRPMDSWKTAMGKLRPSQLLALQDSCRKLAERIEELHETKLVKHGMIDGKFPHSYPFELPARLRHYADDFLPYLIEMTKRIGPKQRPDYNRILTTIYEHIHEATNAWHDKLVATILNDLFAFPSDKLKTEGSLRQWRSDNKVTGQRESE